MPQMGLVHIYCGDGKGKTSAATGLLLRAAGSGMRVLLARFMKGGPSGELNVLKALPNVGLMDTPEKLPFYHNLTPEQEREYRAAIRGLWERVTAAALSGEWDMLVMDELCAAITCGLIAEEEALRLLRERPGKLEVVITGRNPPKGLLEAADYVSELRCVKHPYERGIPARRGIEY